MYGEPATIESKPKGPPRLTRVRYRDQTSLYLPGIYQTSLFQPGLSFAVVGKGWRVRTQSCPTSSILGNVQRADRPPRPPFSDRRPSEDTASSSLRASGRDGDHRDRRSGR